MLRVSFVGASCAMLFTGLAACRQDEPPVQAAAAVPPVQVSAHATSPVKIVGFSAGQKFAHIAPINADMDVRQTGDVWQIRLFGGADQTAGTAVAADCEIHAEGHRTGDTIEAALVPFSSDDSEVTADDLKDNPGTVTVKLASGSADVTTKTGGLCPIGSSFDGKYLQK